jgi:hypothetical protein
MPLLSEGMMLLIAYYVIFVIAGSLSDYFIGLIVEREFGGQVSLLVFLALYFAVLWLHRLPRLGREGQHRRWDRELVRGDRQ